MEDKKANRIDLRFNKLPSKQFPLQGVFYEGLDNVKKDVVKQLLYLFVYYASKGSKHNYNQLQQHYFMQVMKETYTEMGKKLQKNKDSWKDIQIIYYSKGCQNSLSFRNFLQLLPQFASHLHPQEKIQDSLKMFIDLLIVTYKKKVHPQIEGKLVDVNLTIAEDTREYLNKLSSDFKRLYKLYFPNEVTAIKCSQTKLKQKSLQGFFQLLKDFQIFPKLIAARDVFYIFNESCDSEPNKLVCQREQTSRVMSELGDKFKFSKFLQSLLTISRRVFSKLKKIQNQQQWLSQQKYVLRTLLQYMQIVKTTNKKKTKFINQKFCFIVLDQYPEKKLIKSAQMNHKINRKINTQINFSYLMDKMNF